MEKVHGDVLRLYVMPPGSTFPWVKLFHHPYGIKRGGQEVDSLDAIHDRELLARMIGEMVIDASPILTEWTGSGPSTTAAEGEKEAGP